MPRYKVNGDIYNIPEDKVNDFEKVAPEGTTIEIFNNDRRGYDLPINLQGQFKDKYKNWSYDRGDIEERKIGPHSLISDPLHIEPTKKVEEEPTNEVKQSEQTTTKEVKPTTQPTPQPNEEAEDTTITNDLEQTSESVEKEILSTQEKPQPKAKPTDWVAPRFTSVEKSGEEYNVKDDKTQVAPEESGVKENIGKYKDDPIIKELQANEQKEFADNAQYANGDKTAIKNISTELYKKYNNPIRERVKQLESRENDDNKELNNSIDKSLNSIADQRKEWGAEKDNQIAQSNKIRGIASSNSTNTFYNLGAQAIEARKEYGAKAQIEKVFNDKEVGTQMVSAIGKAVANDNTFQENAKTLKDKLKEYGLNANATEEEIKKGEAEYNAKLAGLSPEDRAKVEKETKEKEEEIKTLQDNVIKAYNDALDKAQKNVSDDVQSYVIDALAKGEIPTSNAEYILKSIYNGSLVGTLIETIIDKKAGGEGLDRTVSKYSLQGYNAPFWAEALAGAGSILADAPIFAFTGAIAGLGSKSVAGVAKYIVGKQLGKNMTKNVVARYATSKGAVKLGASLTSGALNLGSYNALNALASQNLESGKGKIDWGEVGKQTLKGIVSGAGLSAVGYGSNVLKNSGWANRARANYGTKLIDRSIDTASFIGENMAFLGTDVLFGEDMTWRGVGQSFAVLGLLKGKSAIENKLKGIKNSSHIHSEVEQALSNLSLTTEEKEAIYGVIGTKNETDIIGKIGGNSTQIVKQRGSIGTEYDKIMQSNEVPQSAKIKLEYLATGKVTLQGTLATSMDTTKTENGTYVVKSYNPKGEVVTIKEFSNSNDAHKYVNSSVAILERNTGAILYNALQAKNNYNALQEQIREGAILLRCSEAELADACYKVLGIKKGKEDLQENVIKIAERIISNASAKGVTYQNEVIKEVADRNGIEQSRLFEILNTNRGLRTGNEQKIVDDYLKSLYDKLTTKQSEQPKEQPKEPQAYNEKQIDSDIHPSHRDTDTKLEIGQEVDKYITERNDSKDKPNKPNPEPPLSEEEREALKNDKPNDDNPQQPPTGGSGAIMEEKENVLEQKQPQEAVKPIAVAEQGETMPTSEGGVDGKEASANKDIRIGASLSAQQADEYISTMEQNAEQEHKIELTPQNWIAEFGKEGKVSTPIGEVKMGENQYVKLEQKGRNGKLGMVKPTLERPEIIIADYRPAKDGKEERPYSYIFIKPFIGADGERMYYFTSVTVSKGRKEVVISNQEKDKDRISKLLQEGKVVWINKRDSLHPTTQIKEPIPLNDSNKPTQIDNQSALLGINSPNSTDKDNKNNNTLPKYGELTVENAGEGVTEIRGGKLNSGYYIEFGIDKKGRKHGIYREWYKNGQLHFEWSFKNGKEYGHQRAWYENGQLHYDGYTKNGKDDGVCKEYNDLGELRGISYYIDGKNVTEEEYYKQRPKEKITPSQQSLLVGNNPQQYPADKELSNDKDTQTKSNKQEETDADAVISGNDRAQANVDSVLGTEEKTTEPTQDETRIATVATKPAPRLSNEVDSNGKRFVLSSNGTTTFGTITADTSLTEAPVKLSEGYQDNNGGYGLKHIEERHGDQIRKAGFNSVEEFVEYVATNYDHKEIIKGKIRADGTQTYIIQVEDKHANILFIELSKDGKYWDVNSGGVFRKKYAENKDVAEKPEVSHSSATNEPPLRSNGQTNDSQPIDPNGNDVQHHTTKVTNKTESASAEENNKQSREIIDDFGEKIEGARKDALKKIAKELSTVTEQSLVSLPLSKSFKRPNTKALLQSGLINREEAVWLEALSGAILGGEAKPKLNNKVAKWAKAKMPYINLIKEFVEGDATKRAEIIKRLSEPTEEALSQYNKQLEKVKAGEYDQIIDRPIPSDVWFSAQILSRIGDDAIGNITMLPTCKSLFNFHIDIMCRGKNIGSSFTSVDKAIDAAVWMTKLENGIADVEIPIEEYSTHCTNSRKEFTGRVIVSSHQFGRMEFNSENEAEKFLCSKKFKDRGYGLWSNRKEDAYFHKETRSIEAGPYKISFTDPITNKTYEYDKEYESRAEADTALDNDYEQINRWFVDKIQEGTTRVIKQYAKVFEENGKYIVGVLDSDKNYVRVGKYDKKADADKRCKELIESEEKDKKAYKNKIEHYSEKSSPRVGTDYRHGKDATEDMFLKELGFRGVQFGNWTSQKDRQNAMNSAYDAFRDLAEVLGVTPKALSLNGELGLAFGARGSSSPAHYECKDVVINISKITGAGSLAHEWAHALDNYFARKYGVANGFITSKDVRSIPNVRALLDITFSNLMDAVYKSDYYKRSNRKGEYWSRDTEMFARLFADYVTNKLAEQHKSNHFLTDSRKNWIFLDNEIDKNYKVYRLKEWYNDREPMSRAEFAETKDAIKTFPYVTAEELKLFKPLLDNLFNTIQEDENNVLYRSDATPREHENSQSNTKRTTYRERVREIFQKQIKEVLNSVVKAMGIENDFEIVNSLEQLRNISYSAWQAVAQGADVKAFYYRDKVYIYLPKCRSVRDGLLSIFHEVVAHKGLRQLLGKRFDSFCDGVWKSMSEAERRAEIKNTYNEMSQNERQRILGVNAPKYWEDLTAEQRQRVYNDKDTQRYTADEYCANMAEEHGGIGKGGFSNIKGEKIGIWDKICYYFNRALRALGIKHKFSKSDIAYLLSKSNDAFYINNEKKSNNDTARFRIGDKYNFDKYPLGKVENGLNDKEIKVNHLTTHKFGNANLSMISDWIDKTLRGKPLEGTADKGIFVVGRSSRNKILQVISKTNGEMRDVYLATLENLGYIIGDSLDVETHPDFNKGTNELRDPQNGYDKNNVIHRLYGAIEYNGKIYRVKTTVKENIVFKQPLTPHTFEVQKIELIDETLYGFHNNGGPIEPVATNISSISAAKLLKNVTMSYNKGKNILDESKKVDSDTNTDNDDIRFRIGDSLENKSEEELKDIASRGRAIKELTPIDIVPHDYNKAELFDIYKALKPVRKNGESVRFYNSLFDKIYRHNSNKLFPKIVPQLSEIFENSIFAYSEPDDRGGQVRPDGTIHKDHKNVLSFDNYVGKVTIDGKDYYVRFTIQMNKGENSGVHSTFVTNVALYEQNKNNNFAEKTIPASARGTTHQDEVVDTKLQKFFNDATEAENILNNSDDIRFRIDAEKATAESENISENASDSTSEADDYKEQIKKLTYTINAKKRTIKSLRERVKNMGVDVVQITKELTDFASEGISKEVIPYMGKSAYNKVLSNLKTGINKALREKDTEKRRTLINNTLARIEEQYNKVLIKYCLDDIATHLTDTRKVKDSRGLTKGKGVTADVEELLSTIKPHLTKVEVGQMTTETGKIRKIYGFRKTSEEDISKLENSANDYIERGDKERAIKILTAVNVLKEFNNILDLQDKILQLNVDIANKMAEATKLHNQRVDSESTLSATEKSELWEKEKQLRADIALTKADQITLTKGLAERVNDLHSIISGERAEGKKSFAELQKQRAVQMANFLTNAFVSIYMPQTSLTEMRTDGGKRVQKRYSNRTATLMKNLWAGLTFESLFGAISINDPFHRADLYYEMILGDNGIIEAQNKMYSNIQNDLKSIAQIAVQCGLVEPIKLNIHGSNRALVNELIKDCRRVVATIDVVDRQQGTRNKVTLGQAMYYYAQSLSAHGTRALINGGFEKADIKDLQTMFSEGGKYAKYGEFVRQIINTLLPDMTTRFDVLHCTLYDRHIDQTENYFPLSVSKMDIQKQTTDIGADDPDQSRPSVVAKNLINRVTHSYGINKDASFMNILTSYVDKMERWYAYSVLEGNINTLLNNKDFCQRLNAIMPSGEATLRELSKIALLDTRNPEYHTKIERVGAQIIKASVASKIAFRINTALKQLLSSPAYWSYVADFDYIGTAMKQYNPATWTDTMQWAFDNLPLFRERWESRSAGYEALTENPLSDKFSSFVNHLIKIGMTPNAIVDVFTSAIGAKGVYDWQLQDNLNRGMTEDKAKQDALRRASNFMNQSQQSAQHGYLSEWQTSDNMVKRQFSAFKNASLGYLRKAIVSGGQFIRLLNTDEYNRIKQSLQKSYKEQIEKGTYTLGENEDVESKAEQMASEDMEQAKKTAFVQSVMFSMVLQCLWRVGGKMAKALLLGGDDDKDKKYRVVDIKTDLLREPPLINDMAVIGPTWNKAFDTITGNGTWSSNAISVPFEADVDALMNLYSKIVTDKEPNSIDQTAWYCACSIAFSWGLGVDYKTISDISRGVKHILTGVDRQAGILELLSVPRSQVKAIVGVPKQGETPREYAIRTREVLGILKSGDKDLIRNYFDYADRHLMRNAGIDPTQFSEKSAKVDKIEKALMLNGNFELKSCGGNMELRKSLIEKWQNSTEQQRRAEGEIRGRINQIKNLRKYLKLRAELANKDSIRYDRKAVNEQRADIYRTLDTAQNRIIELNKNR